MSSASKRTTLFLSLVLTCVLLDQATKLLARLLLSPHRNMHFFGDTLRLQLIVNNGGVGGIGATSGDLVQPFFIGWSICMLGTIVAWGLFSKAHGPLAVVAAGLVFSGGMGNILDRLLIGGVIDFINLNTVGLRTAIFNVADLFILSGLAVLLASLMQERRTLARRFPSPQRQA